MEIQTEPPAKLNFTGLLTQWLIYDKYVKYEAAKELAEIEDNKNCLSQRRRKFHQKKEEQVEACVRVEEKLLLAQSGLVAPVQSALPSCPFINSITSVDFITITNIITD